LSNSIRGQSLGFGPFDEAEARAETTQTQFRSQAFFAVKSASGSRQKQKKTETLHPASRWGGVILDRPEKPAANPPLKAAAPSVGGI
jgi:hypothetical protein